jgi:hypothetical protein
MRYLSVGAKGVLAAQAKERWLVPRSVDLSG